MLVFGSQRKLSSKCYNNKYTQRRIWHIYYDRTTTIFSYPSKYKVYEYKRLYRIKLCVLFAQRIIFGWCIRAKHRSHIKIHPMRDFFVTYIYEYIILKLMYHGLCVVTRWHGFCCTLFSVFVLKDIIRLRSI